MSTKKRYDVDFIEKYIKCEIIIDECGLAITISPYVETPYLLLTGPGIDDPGIQFFTIDDLSKFLWGFSCGKDKQKK